MTLPLIKEHKTRNIDNINDINRPEEKSHFNYSVLIIQSFRIFCPRIFLMK